MNPQARWNYDYRNAQLDRSCMEFKYLIRSRPIAAQAEPVKTWMVPIKLANRFKLTFPKVN